MTFLRKMTATPLAKSFVGAQTRQFSVAAHSVRSKFEEAFKAKMEAQSKI